MSRHLPLASYLRVEDVERRARAAQEPFERSWWGCWRAARPRRPPPTPMAIRAIGLARSPNATTPRDLWACIIDSARPCGGHRVCSPQSSKRTCARRWQDHHPSGEGALWTARAVASWIRGYVDAWMRGCVDAWTRAARAARRCSTRLGLLAAAAAQSAGSPSRPYPYRSRGASHLKNKLRPLLRTVATAFPRASFELWATDVHRHVSPCITLASSPLRAVSGRQ